MSTANQPIELTDAEQLIMKMLLDLAREPGSRQLNYDLIEEAISFGHSWGIRWETQNLYNESQDDPKKVKQVADNFYMWSFIERSVEGWSEEQKAEYDALVQEYDRDPRYRGYDGNNEQEYGIANFMVETLGRFREFSGREHNSHGPTAESYARMQRAYATTHGTAPANGTLTPQEVAQIVNVG